MEAAKHEEIAGIEVERTLTIDRSPQDLYRFWRNLENLPAILEHLVSVTATDEKRSHWIAEGPAGTRFEWDAELTDAVENQRLEWRSLPGAQVPNAGQVRFEQAPGDRGTEVRVLLRYDPPGGVIASKFAKLFRKEPSQEVREALRKLKQLMETGEIPTVEGQPAARETKSINRKEIP